jgi:hypothetical protein
VLRGLTHLPLRQLASCKPENARLQDGLARLRARPSMLALVANPAGGGQGGWVGRRAGAEPFNRAEPGRRPMHGQGSFIFVFRVCRQACEA